MGGRGAGSAGTATSAGSVQADVLENLPYNVTSFDDKLGGAVFPFLEQTKRAWRILTHPVGSMAEPHSAHTFSNQGEARPPTLRWVNGSQVSDLYVDGLTTE